MIDYACFTAFSGNKRSGTKLALTLLWKMYSLFGELTMAGGAEVVAQAVAPNVEPTKEKLSGNESS